MCQCCFLKKLLACCEAELMTHTYYRKTFESLRNLNLTLSNFSELTQINAFHILGLNSHFCVCLQNKDSCREQKSELSLSLLSCNPSLFFLIPHQSQNKLSYFPTNFKWYVQICWKICDNYTPFHIIYFFTHLLQETWSVVLLIQKFVFCAISMNCNSFLLQQLFFTQTQLLIERYCIWWAFILPFLCGVDLNCFFLQEKQAEDFSWMRLAESSIKQNLEGT